METTQIQVKVKKKQKTKWIRRPNEIKIFISCDSCNQIMDGPDIYVLNQELAIDQLIQK